MLWVSEPHGAGFEEDLTFAKRTEEAIERYEKGIYKEVDSKDFAEELEKW